MILTYGHGRETAQRTVEILSGAGVQMVIDVRQFPGSRRNPQFGRQELEVWLPANGILYLWDKRLGGRRPCPDDSPDIAWESPDFRGVATYTREDPEFAQGIDEALVMAQWLQVAVMCSESVWWKCHRWLIAIFLQVARGVEVRHLMHDGRLDENPVIPGTRLLENGLLIYDDI